MNPPDHVVSIHPYFKVHPGKMEAVRALLPAFVKITATEGRCLYYDFTIGDGIIFCREAYAGAEGALKHLENVGALLNEMTKLADVMRLEIHGPAAELEKLRQPLAGYNPAYFEQECGVKK